MDTRAAELIKTLRLAPHPEGGYYGEVYRSESRVQPADGRTERRALTTIYFLLAGGDASRWHRVTSDEVWHYYEGAPLELLVADAGFRAISRRALGPPADGVRPVAVVRANEWQAARTTGAYTLVGCTVGPGFEFSDFQMLGARPEDAEMARRRHPEVADLI